MLRSILEFGNFVLSSVNVIVGFSLFVYIFTFNFRSQVAQAFCALISFVTVAHLVDVGITEVDSIELAGVWLKLQWVGIAFVPAAYLHFSDALLRTTGATSRWRRLSVWGSYGIGLATVALVAWSGLIVDGVARKENIYHLVAGPYFRLFAAYYVLTSVSGWVNISRARGRCLTAASRRRMSYLMLAFVAPSVGVFPFLLISAAAQTLSADFISALTLVGNLGIALMTVVIGYIVAYQGVLIPDRVIKHRLLHFLLRGPLVAIAVIILMLAIPRADEIWGVPRDTVLVVTVAGTVVIAQVVINLAKPTIDRLTYRRDRDEIAWMQALDERLLTTADLEQLLENTLIALCDLLRAPSGFIVTMESSAWPQTSAQTPAEFGARPAIRVFCGPREAATRFLAGVSLPELLERLADSRKDEFISNQDFILTDGHWLLPLRGRSDNVTLGILGIWATGPRAEFSDEDLEAVYGLVDRAEMALEDMILQQCIFAVLRGLNSQLDEIQAWRSSLYLQPHSLEHFEANPIRSPGFVQMVRDALSQFWGGPKMTESPLLRLHIIRDRLPQFNNVPANAVRATLQEAIERLKPDGERSMTSNDWLMYNILDLKFIQGERIRDITRRLAMSESDFYRKQRIAIEQVAAMLAQMEQAYAQNAFLSSEKEHASKE
ncbi:MAG: hypothetical protein H5T69_11140 [Chloroflexi bacterium]|nr:hypothetical protein [Chloroflexota bacterium]